MKLLIDAGNTRIKWALVDGDDWVRNGLLPVDEAGKLAQQFAGMREIQQIWVSNVAGEEISRHILDIKVVQPHFVVAREEQCGVRNGYTTAGQLGSDRWAALIAAWHLTQHRGCLVVNSGTATTIDALSGQGHFLGGLIVPGMELMQRSLVAVAGRLNPEQGAYVTFPKNTADGLVSGAIQATCGAIERQHALLEDDAAPVMMSGGAAAVLQQHLGMPLRIVDNLVLQGLLLISQEAGER